MVLTIHGTSKIKKWIFPQNLSGQYWKNEIPNFGFEGLREQLRYNDAEIQTNDDGLGKTTYKKWDQYDIFTYECEFYLPAVIIHLKHDFWSILCHTTYLAVGLSCFNVNIHKLSAMPVAMGPRNAELTEFTPKIIAVHSSMIYRYNSRQNCNQKTLKSPAILYWEIKW